MGDGGTLPGEESQIGGSRVGAVSHEGGGGEEAVLAKAGKVGKLG
jgi:hypothetical protein